MIAPRVTAFEETFIHLMEMVTRHCLPATTFPTVYTDEELKQIALSAMLIIGAEEKIYNPKKAIDLALRFMPDLTAEIISNSRSAAVPLLTALDFFHRNKSSWAPLEILNGSFFRISNSSSSGFSKIWPCSAQKDM